MRAAVTAQLRLLDLQAVDTAIAQVEHRRRSLPELARIAERQRARARQGEDLVAARTTVADLELEQEKAETDLTPVRQRLERDRQRVDNGSVTDPKQLTALVEEIAHLRRRIGVLEDAELEVMQRLEDATSLLDRLTAERAAGDTELRALIAARDEKFAELDADLGERRAERDRIAAEIPAELVQLYDRQRSKSGGTGAAALQYRRCSGCQLEATSADLARYTAAATDEVLRCEECDRILVRVGASA